MSKPVYVITEQRNGAFRKVSFEVVSEARRLADELGTSVVAILLGSGVSGIGEELGQYGADKVLVADNEIFENYSAEGYTKTILETIKNVDPEIVLLPASILGKDLAPRLAANLAVGLASDCVKLSIESGKLEAQRPMYAGKVIADYHFNSSPQLASLRPNIFPVLEPDSSKKAEVENVSVPVTKSDLKAIVKELLASEGGKIDISEADIIVSGGRGMKGAENFKILEELADLLGGAVGASRSAVDSDWRAHADQVGQTGKTVAPDLYIACGISGAIQHLAGMSSSKCIVAINKDPDAPIFQKADYGIVGDLFDVVPKLTEELKKIVE
ncbi:electron transfer flavoprotein subunit alpha [candidate division KSB1 bacterium 4572_119]|nr:MAG: electron transfer flavoprotein subunit alpha [candidate division KSB1 bacterium 4572_119]